MILKKEISKDTFNYNANSPEITRKYIYTTSSKATVSAATTETATIEQSTIFDEKRGNNHQFHYYEISRDKTNHCRYGKSFI